MKRTFKMKALVFSMIVMMVFNFIPNLYAAKYENSIEESAADIVCSLTADKTEVVPGDVVTVSFSVTKMPANGLGIRAFSARMVYDSSKLELNNYYDEDYEENFVDIQAGKVGKKLGFMPGSATVVAESGMENRNRISMGLAVDSALSAKSEGDVVVMKFTVKEGATGPIEFYLKSDSVEDDGFAVAGNKYDENDNLVVDGDMTYYVSTNLDELKVLTPANSVSFDGIEKVELNTTTNTTKNVASYVVIDPTDTTDTMSWHSEDTAVATVDANGNITAVGKGTTNIVVTVGEKTASLPVTVKVLLNGLGFENLNSVELDVTNNPTADIKGNVQLTPANADVDAYEWLTDNAQVATVENGVVTAVGKGSANITVKVGEFIAIVPVNVSVSASEVEFENIQKLVLDTANNTTADLKANLKVTPADADKTNAQWSTDNAQVATVENGVVTAVGKGNANITVQINGKTATIPVVVTVPVTGVEFENIDSVALDVTNNPTADISQYVKLTPADADVAACEWTSENTDVVTVDQNGVLTAVGKGNTMVSVKVDGYTASVEVNVTASIKEASFDINEFTLDVKDETTKDLTTALKYNPENADVKNITWSSSDEKVATVKDGLVTAVGKGSATITADVDGKLATVKVNVVVKLESISIEPAEVTVYKNDEVSVKVKADQEGAVIDTLNGSFQSGNEYAMFEVNGDTVKITGVAEGTAIINISANKGTTPELNKQVKVTVKENPITSVAISATNNEAVLRGATKTLTAKYETKESEDIHKTTDDTTVTWTSSDEKIATVKDGVVTGLKEGKVTITATIAGKSATYEVEVKEIHVDGIVIDEDTAIKLDELESVTVGDKVEIPFTVTPENYTDTVEEILAFVNTSYDSELVDVEVTYDEAKKAGKITITAKKAGDAEIYIMAGEPESEEDEVAAWKLWFEIVEPVVEEEAPETGDMPVAMLAIVMIISLAGIVVSKKIFIK